MEPKRWPVVPSRLYRTARDAKARRRREAEPVPTLPPTCDLRLGDFRDVLADLPARMLSVTLSTALA